MVSTGTQTSTDDLRLPSRSPAPSGAVPVTPLSNRKVDAASSASTSGQGLTLPAPPGPSAPKGRGLPPRTSAPQRKPGESPKQTTSKGQLPAATDEPMDVARLVTEQQGPPAAPSKSKDIESMNAGGSWPTSKPSSAGSGHGRKLVAEVSDRAGNGKPAPKVQDAVGAVDIADSSGGTCESRCLESGVSTDPEPCGFARPRLAVRGFPVSGEKGILVVEPSPGLNTIRGVLSEDDFLHTSEEELLEGLQGVGVVAVKRIIFRKNGGTCKSRCLVSGITTDPVECGFARPHLAVHGCPVSGEKGILVVEPSPGHLKPRRREQPPPPPKGPTLLPDEKMDESLPLSEDDQSLPETGSLPLVSSEGVPVKAGVWRVESPRTPSPAGGACTLGARCLVSSVTMDPSHVHHHTRMQGAPTLVVLGRATAPGAGAGATETATVTEAAGARGGHNRKGHGSRDSRGSGGCITEGHGNGGSWGKGGHNRKGHGSRDSRGSGGGITEGHGNGGSWGKGGHNRKGHGSRDSRGSGGCITEGHGNGGSWGKGGHNRKGHGSRDSRGSGGCITEGHGNGGSWGKGGHNRKGHGSRDSRGSGGCITEGHGNGGSWGKGGHNRKGHGSRDSRGSGGGTREGHSSNGRRGSSSNGSIDGRGMGQGSGSKGMGRIGSCSP
ncbi:hypothetical protein ISCGN_016431 [Ixodes scapularis]